MLYLEKFISFTLKYPSLVELLSANTWFVVGLTVEYNLCPNYPIWAQCLGLVTSISIFDFKIPFSCYIFSLVASTWLRPSGLVFLPIGRTCARIVLHIGMVEKKSKIFFLRISSTRRVRQGLRGFVSAATALYWKDGRKMGI